MRVRDKIRVKKENAREEMHWMETSGEEERLPPKSDSESIAGESVRVGNRSSDVDVEDCSYVAIGNRSQNIRVGGNPSFVDIANRCTDVHVFEGATYVEVGNQSEGIRIDGNVEYLKVSNRVTNVVVTGNVGMMLVSHSCEVTVTGEVRRLAGSYERSEVNIKGRVGSKESTF